MVTGTFWSSAAAATLPSLFSPILHAQGSWHQAVTQGNAPARALHGAAYDLPRERTVLFGGMDDTLTITASTYEFDGVTWLQVQPSTSPTARSRHAMVYDSARRRVVLFGGTPSVFGLTCFSDTWEFDGADWAQLLPTTAPPARYDHAMAFDMFAGATVLFGGRHFQQGLRGDTWTWDGTDWSPVASPGPGPRYRHAMTFDILRGRTVLFGGKDPQPLDDTWEFDRAAWHHVYPAVSPGPRSGHGLVYDLGRGICVLHGGPPFDDETWEWDGSSWTHTATATARADHALVYDARLMRTTLHGGASQPGVFLPETYTYGRPAPGSYTPIGSSCAGSVSAATLAAPTAMAGPTIGASSSVYVTASWFHVFFVFGWSDTWDGNLQLPFDLASYGMPGCTLQVSRDFVDSEFPVNGVAIRQIQIPYNPFLVGSEFYVQAFSLDLAANAGGFTTTNHLKASVGGY